MKRLLLHACCGPCTIYPCSSLRSQDWTVFGFFYNPFIQPFQEFERRLQAFREYARSADLEVIVREDYSLREFFRQVSFRENERCLVCYSTRIEATARLAKKSGFDAFSTTLLYSKQQKHETIRNIALEASRRYGIPFHYEDFRTGWKHGQEEARRLGIYRQQYCGCLYSEQERFQKKR